MHFLNHPPDRRIIFLDNGVVHLSEAERIECTLLNCRAVDTALYLFDFYLCHCCDSLDLAFEYFFDRNATVLCDSGRTSQLVKSRNRGFYQVVGVGRSF